MAASGFVVIISSIASGALAALALSFVAVSTATKSANAGPLALLGLFAFFVLLAIIPWLVLSRRWTWWLGSLIGAAAGLIVALVITLSLFPAQLNICISGCNPSPPPSTPVLETLLLFTILLGLFGAGQALSLRSAPRKPWFFSLAPSWSKSTHPRCPSDRQQPQASPPGLSSVAGPHSCGRSAEQRQRSGEASRVIPG